jgi:hypothetical protein
MVRGTCGSLVTFLKAECTAYRGSSSRCSAGERASKARYMEAKTVSLP